MCTCKVHNLDAGWCDSELSGRILTEACMDLSGGVLWTHLCRDFQNWFTWCSWLGKSSSSEILFDSLKASPDLKYLLGISMNTPELGQYFLMSWKYNHGFANYEGCDKFLLKDHSGPIHMMPVWFENGTTDLVPSWFCYGLTSVHTMPHRVPFSFHTNISSVFILYHLQIVFMPASCQQEAFP